MNLRIACYRSRNVKRVSDDASRYINSRSSNETPTGLSKNRRVQSGDEIHQSDPTKDADNGATSGANEPNANATIVRRLGASLPPAITSLPVRNYELSVTPLHNCCIKLAQSDVVVGARARARALGGARRKRSAPSYATSSV
ncbi:hypothetical protein LSAT2_029273 [Lamellibrachia satsuma]|nr:hypothetical protein LSAT2_029273 [Lamellibrachia satsuma]